MSTSNSNRLLLALALVALWAAITVFGGLAQSGQGSLAALVSQQVVWATPAAALFLLISAWLLGWRDLGLNPPRPASSVRLLWLIGLYLLGLGTLAAATGKFSNEMLLIIVVNTAFVGFSEELAFRGVLWGAARKAMAFWPGVLLVSALFGSVHVLNAFITGHIGEAGIQAVNAFLSGFAYLALRIRTRSLFPIMVAHWLWDLTVFLAAANGGEGSQAEPATRLLFGVALVAPIAFYGLWLLRKREFHIVTDNLLAARDGAGPGATNPTRAAQS